MVIILLLFISLFISFCLFLFSKLHFYILASASLSLRLHHISFYDSSDYKEPDIISFSVTEVITESSYRQFFFRLELEWRGVSLSLSFFFSRFPPSCLSVYYSFKWWCLFNGINELVCLVFAAACSWAWSLGWNKIFVVIEFVRSLTREKTSCWMSSWPLLWTTLLMPRAWRK